MAIYVRPGGNDALGGTNDTSDALQTLSAAWTKYDRTNPDKRDIVVCADTVGGVGNFGGPSNRFFNNNESLWQFGTSEAQRMSISGRVGDTVIFTPYTGALYWFLFKDAFRYFTMANFMIDGINKTVGGDNLIKCYSNTPASPDQVELIFDNLSLINEHTDALKIGSLANGWRVTSCLFKDFGRVGANNQGLYSEGRNGLIQGNVAYKTTGNMQATGLRCYTNHGSILEGYPESANNTMNRNLVYDCQTGLAFAGSGLLIMNNYLLRMSSVALDFIPQASGSNNGVKVLNNSGYGLGAGDHGFYNLAPGNPYANLEIQNNILWNYTNPVNLNGGSATVNANNLTASDPLYTDQATNDLSIPTGSPAKNNGVTRAEVTEDFLGTLRPQGAAYDQGAFEFVEAAQAGYGYPGAVNVGVLSAPRSYVFISRP